MKLLVNWLLGLASAEEQKKNSLGVLRVLDATLANDGDLQAKDNISYAMQYTLSCTSNDLLSHVRAHDRSRLRLAAGCALLKLAKCSVYRDMISYPIFQRLALVVQVGSSSHSKCVY